IGLSGKDIVHPDYYQLFEDFKRQVNSASRFHAESVDVRKDGSTFHVEVHGTPFNYQGKPHLLAVVRDITERVRSEETLRALNAAAAAIQRAARTPDAVFTAVMKQLQALGFTGAVTLLDEAREHFVIRYAVVASQALSRAEKLTGLKAVGYTFPVEQLPIAWQVLAGETVFVSDVAVLLASVVPVPVRALMPTAMRLLEMPRGVIAPLSVKGEIIGFLGVSAARMTEADIPAVTAFANQMGAALENARLHEQAQQEIAERKRAEEEIKRRGEELEALREISLAITAQLGLDKLLQNVVEQGCRLLGVRAGDAYLVDESRGDLELVVCYGYTRDYTGTRLAPGEGIAGKVLQSGTPLIVDDYHHWEGRSPDWEAEPLTAVLSLPLKHGEQVIGVLNFSGTAQAKRFDEHDLWLATLFANQAAIAIENARLYQRSQELVTRITRLYELSIQINEALSLEETLDLVVRKVIKAADAHSAMINLLDQEGHLEFRLGMGADGEPLEDEPPPRPSGTTMSIYRTGAPLMMSGLEEEASLIHPCLRKKGIRAFIGLPLRTRERCIGALFVRYAEPHPFSEEEVQALSLFTNQAAVAIENARLHRETQHRAERLALVNRIARAASATLQLDDLMETVYQEVTSLLQADAFFIALYDEETNELDFRIRVDEGIREHPERRPVGTGLTGLIVAEKRPLLIRNFEEEQEHLPQPARLWGTMKTPASWLGVPMLNGDRMVGVISVQAYRPHAYGEEEQLLLSTIADQVAVAVENARLFEAEREQRELAEALEEAVAVLSSTLQPEEVLDRILEQVSRVVPNDTANIMLIEDDEARIVRWRGYERFGAEEFASTATFRIPETQTLQQMRETGEPIVISDTATYPGWVRAPVQDRLRSYAAAPIIVRDEVIGFLNVDSATPGFFTQAHLGPLRAFAGHAAAAIGNAQLYQAEQAAHERADTLREISRAVGSTLELDEVLSLVLRQAKRVLAYDTASILLFSDGQPSMIAVAGYEDEELVKAEVSLRLGDSLILQAMARNHRPVVIADVREDERWIWVPGAEDVRAWIGAPLLVRGEMIGALMIDSRQPGSYTEADAATAQALANQVAVAIENARLFTSLLQEKERLELLYRLSRHISESLDVRDVAQRALDEICAVVGALHGVAVVREPDSDRLRLVAVSGYDAESVEALDQRLRLRLGNGLVGWVAAQRQPALVNDVTRDERWMRVSGVDDWARSALSVPLVSGDELVGALSIYSDRQAFFNDDHRRLVESAAAVVAAAIANARLYEQAQRRLESLTNLNRASQAVTSSLDVKEILEQIVNLAGFVINSDYTSVVLLDEDGEPALETEDFRGVPPISQRIRSSGVTRYVLDSGQPVVVDMISDEGAISPPLRRPDGELIEANPAIVAAGIRSFVAVPIQAKGRMLGVVFVHSRQPHAFHGQVPLLTTFANQAAVAIENARLFEEEQRRARELAALNSLATAVSRSLDLGEILNEAADRVMEIIRIDAAQYYAGGGQMMLLIFLLDDRDGDLVLHLHRGLDDETVRRLSCVFPHGGLLDTVLERGKPVACPLPGEGALAGMAPSLAAGTLIGVPLIAKERARGVMVILDQEGRTFSPEEMDLLDTVGRQVAIAIENAQLYQAEQRRRQEAETLRQAALALTTSLNRNQVIERILIQLREVVPYDSASVQLLRDDQLEIIGGHGFPNLEELLGVTFDLAAGDNPNREVMRTRAPFIVEDAPAVYSEFAREPHAQAGIRSWLGVPMLVGERLVGMIALDKREPGFYTEEHARLAQAFAAQAAVAIENARLYEEIVATNAELAEALCLREEMIQNVSHELRTPLGIIRGYAELLAEEALGPLEEEARRAAATVTQQALHLTNLVNQLLMFQRVER
ncbi:MAG TPA: GAF domain-containing protein, partial [Anaerolineae bacterium]|nr:GAF domain-containing protein [Anaerolineae bacterium]